MNEPEITINGVKLTEAQAMTVRVAIGAYAMELNHNGLGDDATGKAIAEGYLRAIGQINNLMRN